MPTRLDGIMPAVANRMLDKMGTAATLTSVTRGVYDGTQGERGQDTIVDIPVKVSPPQNFKKAMPDTGTDVKATDGLVYMGTTAIDGSAIPEPRPEHDSVTLYGVIYRLMWVGPMYSGDLVAAYALQIRSS
jgi:hypothetical protein